MGSQDVEYHPGEILLSVSIDGPYNFFIHRSIVATHVSLFLENC